jgi:hypothetical protein
MAITYPKTLKPVRTYPANVQHCIRVRINQGGPNPLKGEVALVRDKALLVGSIPAGSFIGPVQTQVRVAFTAAATLDVGTKLAVSGIIASADIAPQTAAPGVKSTPTGAGLGTVDEATYVWIALQGAVAVAGQADIVIPFYVQAD